MQVQSATVTVIAKVQISRCCRFKKQEAQDRESWLNVATEGEYPTKTALIEGSDYTASPLDELDAEMATQGYVDEIEEGEVFEIDVYKPLREFTTETPIDMGEDLLEQGLNGLERRAADRTLGEKKADVAYYARRRSERNGDPQEAIKRPKSHSNLQCFRKIGVPGAVTWVETPIDPMEAEENFGGERWTPVTNETEFNATTGNSSRVEAMSDEEKRARFGANYTKNLTEEEGARAVYPGYLSSSSFLESLSLSFSLAPGAENGDVSVSARAGLHDERGNATAAWRSRVDHIKNGGASRRVNRTAAAAKIPAWSFVVDAVSDEVELATTFPRTFPDVTWSALVFVALMCIVGAVTRERISIGRLWTKMTRETTANGEREGREVAEGNLESETETWSETESSSKW